MTTTRKSSHKSLASKAQRKPCYKAARQTETPSKHSRRSNAPSPEIILNDDVEATDDLSTDLEDCSTKGVEKQSAADAEQLDASPSNPKLVAPITPAAKGKSKPKTPEPAAPKKPRSTKAKPAAAVDTAKGRSRTRKPVPTTTRQLRPRKAQPSPTPAKRAAKRVAEDQETGGDKKRQKVVKFDSANLEKAKKDAAEARLDPHIKGLKSPNGRRATGRPPSKIAPRTKASKSARLSKLREVSTNDSNSHLPTQPEESDKEKSPDRKRKRAASDPGKQQSKSQRTRRANSEPPADTTSSPNVSSDNES
ncbi:hypothetical protein PT974_12099 [Cladobotryum mycophilum]|uniref:Uncharacterized protein n=1 Tax=Cladobotryum mycophilum TaxID=491253 RepID=A0ABR0S722_9HYPO